MIPFYKADMRSFIGEELFTAVLSGQVTNFGKYHGLLQHQLEEFLHQPIALVASGTNALTLALLALRNLGRLPSKARILVPSFTFIASVQAILLADMVPILADIKSDTFTLDYNKDYPAYDAIMPVNIFGVQPELPTDKIIIGDLSHGFGGQLHGRLNGTEGTINAFSTSVTKPFHTIEGGFVTSGDKELINNIRSMSRWCLDENYDCSGVGTWSKMSELNAIAGLKSLENLSKNLELKDKLVYAYKEALSGLPIQYQLVPEDCKTTHKDFCICVPTELRAKVIHTFQQNSIGYKLYFSPAVHQTTYFKNKLARGDLSTTEKIAASIICLPMHHALTLDNVSFIGETIRKCF